MSRLKLVALEACLIGAALAVVLIVLLSRGSSSTTPAAEEPPVTAPSAGQAPEVDSELPTRVSATPDDGSCEPTTVPKPLSEAQILSYYGNPYIAEMGILGELPPAELVDKLKAHARLYDSLNGPLAIQPALHLVYGTAQSEPYDEGLYLLYVDDDTLEDYIHLACENGLLIFLDLQIGRSDVQTEITKILPYLEQPHVHAALDPEFAMPEGEVPGQTIGSLDAADVNAAQAILDDFLGQRHLPDKMLVVHQFTEGMLKRPELLQDYARVKLIIDMDGFGPAEIKRVKYGWFAAPAEHSGIKLFFRQDPDLMSEDDVLELKPDLIIYQ